MKMKKILFFILACLIINTIASASQIVVHEFGTASGPDYKWWYGCSPTSAGMLMGYYDINGYDGLEYDNLISGGTAETVLFGISGLSTNAIASQGHINAYYTTSYNTSGDDTYRDPGEYNSLADFMGTSQDAYSNSNGITKFYFWGDGTRMTGDQILYYGYQDWSGMYGIWEYVSYAGYEVAQNQIFNQYSDSYMVNGFSFDDYMAEIDAGRVMLIHVTNHTMFAYGYDADTNEILLHDTWNEGEHRMTWGGTYAGMSMVGVTGFILAGGVAVPEPGTLTLFGLGLVGLLFSGKKREDGALQRLNK